MWPLHIFKLPTLLSCSLEKETKLLCKGKVPSIHGLSSNQKTYSLSISHKSVCIFAWHKFTDQLFCLTLSWFLPPVISEAYCFRDCIQTTEITLMGGNGDEEKNQRYVTSDVRQLFLHIFKPVSCQLSNWVKLVWRGRASRFFLFKMFHIHDLG